MVRTKRTIAGKACLLFFQSLQFFYFILIYSDPPHRGRRQIQKEETAEERVARLLREGVRGECALIENPSREWKLDDVVLYFFLLKYTTIHRLF